METPEQKWYDKKWLVIILCVLFWPVGFYALYKNRGFTNGLKWAIAIATIGIFTLWNINTKNDEPIVSGENTVKPVTEDIALATDSVKANKSVSDWSYDESVDKMTSKKTSFASVTAIDVLDFKFPYNGGASATLTIRKKAGRTDVYLFVSKGQFHSSSLDEGSVRIRFDDNQPKSYSYSKASDGSSDIIFINSEKNVIGNLKISEKIIIEAEFYNEGNRLMEFNTKGLKWD